MVVGVMVIKVCYGVLVVVMIMVVVMVMVMVVEMEMAVPGRRHLPSSRSVGDTPWRWRA